MDKEKDTLNIVIYIDANNLHRAAKDLGFEIDYMRLYRWLSQRYNAQKIYLFMGFIPSKEEFYLYLKDCEFTLIFKETIAINGSIKGNCDAELVLKAVSDFYTGDFNTCVIITGDGDFGCLIEFLRNKSAIREILAPNKAKCSFLIKNKNVAITFLDEQYHKFSTSRA